MNCNEEFITKFLGKFTLEYPQIDQLKIRSLIYESLNNLEVVTVNKSITLSDMEEKIHYYVSVKKLEGLSVNTIKNYLYVLNKFSRTINKPVRSITTNDIRMYLSLDTANNSNTTINSKQSILKSFFEWLDLEELIDKNPAKKLKPIKVPKRLRKSLTIEELELLRDACISLRERAVIELIYATGCRVSEVVKLNKSDLNFIDNSILVIGKGNKERIVYFSPKTKVHLNKYLNMRVDNSPALFVSTKLPYERVGKRTIERVVKAIAERAGIDKKVFPHLIRHTTATIAHQSGASLTTIQHILGHSNPSTTQIYAEASQESINHEYKQFFIH